MNLDKARSVILSSAANDYNPDEGFNQEEFYSAVSVVLSAELGDGKPPFVTTDWTSRVVRHVRDGEPLVVVDQEWEDLLADLYSADENEGEEQDLDHHLTEPCSVHRSWTCTARCERRHRSAGRWSDGATPLFVPADWIEAYGSTTSTSTATTTTTTTHHLSTDGSTSMTTNRERLRDDLHAIESDLADEIAVVLDGAVSP